MDPSDGVGFGCLLKGAREGDERSFAELWRAFNPPLGRFLSGLAGPDDAADLASAVWADVVRGLSTFAGSESGFRAWLFTIARSRAVDLRRAQSRRVVVVEPEGAAVGARARVVADPADEVAERSATEQAVGLIGSLPPDQAEVLLLRVIADLDVAEVARITGKRPGTVRVLSHRGLQRLASQLAATDDRPQV